MFEYFIIISSWRLPKTRDWDGVICWADIDSHLAVIRACPCVALGHVSHWVMCHIRGHEYVFRVVTVYQRSGHRSRVQELSRVTMCYHVSQCVLCDDQCDVPVSGCRDHRYHKCPLGSCISEVEEIRRDPLYCTIYYWLNVKTNGLEIQFWKVHFRQQEEEIRPDRGGQLWLQVSCHSCHTSCHKSQLWLQESRESYEWRRGEQGRWRQPGRNPAAFVVKLKI